MSPFLKIRTIITKRAESFMIKKMLTQDEHNFIFTNKAWPARWAPQLWRGYSMSDTE